MDTVLNESAKQVKVLSAQARKGTIESLYLQIDMGKLIFVAHEYWKANKKALGITRDELSKMHGVGNSFFGELKNASKVPIEDTEKYIESLGDEPTASIKGLLKFLKPEVEKADILLSFSQAKTDEDEGLSVRIDEDGKVITKSNKFDLLNAIYYLQQMVQEMEGIDEEVMTIELIEA